MICKKVLNNDLSKFKFEITLFYEANQPISADFDQSVFFGLVILSKLARTTSYIKNQQRLLIGTATNVDNMCVFKRLFFIAPF